MTQQSRKAILEALVTLIETEVTDFNLVTASPEFDLMRDIPTTQRPACLIESGSRQSIHNVTSTYDFELIAAIYIVCDHSTSDGDVYDLDEAVLDAINSDLTLSGTCIYIFENDADPPRLWPRGDMKVIEQRVRIRYRRDV